MPASPSSRCRRTTRRPSAVCPRCQPQRRVLLLPGRLSRNGPPRRGQNRQRGLPARDPGDRRHRALRRAQGRPHAAHPRTRGRLGEDQIQVNAVLPGWIDTTMTRAARTQAPSLWDRVLARTPAGRWKLPEDFAGVAVFLASAALDFVNGRRHHRGWPVRQPRLIHRLCDSVGRTKRLPRRVGGTIILRRAIWAAFPARSASVRFVVVLPHGFRWPDG